MTVVSPNDVYYGTVADYYDLFLAEVEFGDADIYRNAIEGDGEPALELACGTGRLLLGYVAAGLDVEGEDSSHDMLGICRTKAARRGLGVTLYHEPMQALHLPRRYRTMYCPVCSFALLTDPGEARAALTCFHQHLEPGGTILLPMSFPWTDGAPRSKDPIDEWYLRRRAIRPEDGAELRCWAFDSYDIDSQLLLSKGRNEVVLEGRIEQCETYELSTRWWRRDEFEAMLSEAGFTDIHAVDVYSDRPATDNSDIFTVIATRP